MAAFLSLEVFVHLSKHLSGQSLTAAQFSSMNKGLRSQRFSVGCGNIQFQSQSVSRWKKDCFCCHGKRRALLWHVLIFLFAHVPLSGATPGDIVATANGQPIYIRDVDEQSSVQIKKLREELAALLTRTVDRLIDEQLRATASPEMLEVPPLPPITDEEVRSYRVTREKEVETASPADGNVREPKEQTALLRHYLEQKAREAAEMQMRQRLRQGHIIRLSLPSPQELESPVTRERQIAQVDGTWIRAAEFERAAAWRLYQLRRELYRERSRNLEPIIENQLLQSEAQRREIPLETLLAELSAKESVSADEVETFLAAEQQAGRTVPTVERAYMYLEFRKAYDRRQRLMKKLRQEAAVKVLLKEPATPRFPVADTGSAVLGTKRGKRLIVYTNYRCATCRTVQQEIDTLLKQEKSLRVIFHDFIVGYDPVATEAAYLSRCAAQWGAFARMRQELLTREPPPFGSHWYKDSELPQLLRRVRIRKRAEFLECLGTDVYKGVERDTASARELGFDDPPAYVAEGVPLAGVQSAGNLALALTQGLKNPAARTQEENTDISSRRHKGRRLRQTEWIDEPTSRRSRRSLRSSRKQEVTSEASSRTRVKSPSLQKPKLSRPPVAKKAPSRPRRDKLFDME